MRGGVRGWEWGGSGVGMARHLGGLAGLLRERSWEDDQRTTPSIIQAIHCGVHTSLYAWYAVPMAVFITGQVMLPPDRCSGSP